MDDPNSWIDVDATAAALEALDIHHVAPASGADAPPSTPPSRSASSGTLSGDTGKTSRCIRIEGTECLHFIGTESARLCLKERKIGEMSYDISHRGSGRMQITEPMLVIRAQGMTAHASYSLPVSLFDSMPDLLEALLEESHTPEQWGQIFAMLHQGEGITSRSDIARRLELLECPSPVSTLWKNPDGGHDETIIHIPDTSATHMPKLYYSLDIHRALEENTLVATAQYLENVDGTLQQMVQDTLQLASDMDHYVTINEQNREKMDTHLMQIDAKIGQPFMIGGEAVPARLVEQIAEDSTASARLGAGDPLRSPRQARSPPRLSRSCGGLFSGDRQDGTSLEEPPRYDGGFE